MRQITRLIGVFDSQSNLALNGRLETYNVERCKLLAFRFKRLVRRQLLEKKKMSTCKIIENLRRSNGALALELPKEVHDHVVQVSSAAIDEITRLRVIITEGRKGLIEARLVTDDEIISWPI